MRFEEKIEWLMRDRGLNQETLASALELSQSTVSRWLNGAKPHRRIALNIAIFFNIDVESLLNDKLDLPPGFMPPEQDTAPSPQTPSSAPEGTAIKNLSNSGKGSGKGDERKAILVAIHQMREAMDALEKALGGKL